MALAFWPIFQELVFATVSFFVSISTTCRLCTSREIQRQLYLCVALLCSDGHGSYAFALRVGLTLALRLDHPTCRAQSCTTSTVSYFATIIRIE
ncbi:hypothetical protein F5Y18DRAFT_383666 [Xylariaceae sp. FL1019]|nr:hypothetical protein F5Y18DRAFT_383666 [Xylariaceae sp. FL1019]